MASRNFWSMAFLFVALVALPAQANSIPYLSFQDLTALYPKSKPVFDWDWPTVKVDDQSDLVKQCKDDFASYFKETHFKERYPVANGNLVLRNVIKDPSNAIIYLAFKIEPEDLPDLMMIYFYNPKTRTFVLKTMLSL